MKTVASLRYGVIFKKAFNNVDVFKSLVRDIDKVETEIAEITDLDEQTLLPLRTEN